MNKKTLKSYYPQAFQLGSSNPFEDLKYILKDTQNLGKDPRIKCVGDIQDLEAVIEKEDTEVEKF